VTDCLCRQMKGGETSTYLIIPIVSTLDRGEFTVKLRAFSSQREDYEEIPIKVDVGNSISCILRSDNTTHNHSFDHFYSFNKIVLP